MLNVNEQGAAGSSLDLATCSAAHFAVAVHAAIKKIGHAPHERFGPRKVFISAIARELDIAAHGLSRADFETRLFVCRRLGQLSLARADLVAAMPADAVAASEIKISGVEFHFVIDQYTADEWDRERAS